MNRDDRNVQNVPPAEGAYYSPGEITGHLRAESEQKHLVQQVDAQRRRTFAGG